MTNIGTPLRVPELGLQPIPEGSIKLSDDMQQTLSLLTAFWKHERVVLKASPKGVLFSSSPPLQAVINVTAASGNYSYQGSNLPCSEVIVMSNPDNTGRVWVNVHASAAANTGVPLDAGDVIGFGLTNLNMLHLLIVTDTEKVIILYA